MMFRRMYASRLSTMKICTVLAVLPLILSGCGSNSGDDTKNDNDVSVVDIADEQGITVQDGSLLYGNLRLELREGIEAEVLSAEEYGNFFAEWEDGTVVSLPGADEYYKRQGEFAPDDLPLPARIRFMNYQVEYENEEALISWLFSLIPDAAGKRIYAEEAKCEYAYQMWQDEAEYQCQYFIFVQGNDVYLMEEIQGTGMHWGGHFTVGSLLSDNVLSWKDSGTLICPVRNEEALHRPEDGEENKYSRTLGTEIIPESQYIPQELLDELADAVLLGIETEAEAVSKMRIDRELSREDMLSLAERSRDIFLEIVENYPACWVTADCDNDGIEDIIVQLLNGGSAGNLEYVFFKGQPDGTYVRTSEFSAFEEEFAVISYQGKNYLCRMPFDFDRRIDYGFTLIAYEDGERVEEVSLTLVPEDYDVRIMYDGEENTVKDVSEDILSDYGLLAADIAENCFTIEVQLAEDETVIGSAEQVIDMTDDKGNFCCDLDNDGEAEVYEKHIWKTHHRLSSQLIFTCEDETDAGILLLQEKIEEEGRPLMMWVEPSAESFTEPFAGENIINVFYRTGQEDFKVVGFLLEESDCRKVYEVAADARYEVKKSCQAFGN